MTPEEVSGALECTSDTLTYRSGLGGWSLPVSSLKLIAEYTNADGPGLDDYFFVFLTAPEGGWHEASFYAEGRDATLQTLGEKIGAPLRCGLCGSTEYNTRILWPVRLEGQPLMDVSPGPTGWRKFFDSGVRDISLTQAARQVFA